jgi:hypothetical protein
VSCESVAHSESRKQNGGGIYESQKDGVCVWRCIKYWLHCGGKTLNGREPDAAPLNPPRRKRSIVFWWKTPMPCTIVILILVRVYIVELVNYIIGHRNSRRGQLASKQESPLFSVFQ